MDFYELVTQGWNGLLVSAIASLMVAVEMAVPELFVRGRIGNRLEVVAPIGLAVIAATCIPGPWVPGDVLLGQKLVLGILMGFAAYFTSGVMKRYGASYFREKIVRSISKRAPRKKRTAELEQSED